MSINTKFEDMTGPQIIRWQDWCKSHDWGESAYYQQGRIYGLVDISFKAGDTQATQELVSFETPREIRDWAGY